MKPDVEETDIGSHALLITPEEKIILQQRDTNPNIVNPGKITMFGGTIKASDSPETGLKRELFEELEFNTDNHDTKKLNTFLKTKEIDGVDYTIHVFVVRNVNPHRLKLHEGSGLICDAPENLINNPNITRITKLAIQDFLRSLI